MLRRPALSILALAVAGPALAEVDPSAVWSDLQEAMTSYGYEVATESVTEDASAVTVTGLTLTQTTQGETLSDRLEQVPLTTTVTFALPTLVIADAGAEAEMAFPASMPLTVTNESEGETTVTRGTISQEGMTVTVSEAEGGLAYDYAASAVRFVLDAVEGPEAPDEIAASVTVADFSGRSLAVTEGGVRTVTQTQEAANVAASVRADPPGEEGLVVMSMTLEGFGGTTRLALPEGMSLAALSDPELGGALPEGVAFGGTLETGAIALRLASETPGEAFTYANDGRGIALEVEVGDGRMSYGLTGKGGDVTVTGDQIPLPQVAFSLGGSEMRLDIPLEGAAEAQPFSVLIGLADLAVDEAVWSLFDAGQVLDRGPASLRIDLGGTVAVPEGDGTEAAGMPSVPEPRTLEIAGIDLALLGAALGARGSLEVPEGGMSMMGPPQVVGTLEIDLTGAQALLRDLVTAGLIPAEQAAFAGGMLGFMARPTGEDAFASEIVFGPDGSITANGMPLQ